MFVILTDDLTDRQGEFSQLSPSDKGNGVALGPPAEPPLLAAGVVCAYGDSGCRVSLTTLAKSQKRKNCCQRSRAGGTRCRAPIANDAKTKGRPEFQGKYHHKSVQRTMPRKLTAKARSQNCAVHPGDPLQ